MSARAREWKAGTGGARRKPKCGRFCLAALLVLSGFCLPAQGAGRLDGAEHQEVNQILRLQAGGAKVWRTPFALRRISVAAPDMADLILISEGEIGLLSGEASGPVARGTALALAHAGGT